MIILLHSSKTMKNPPQWAGKTTAPIFQNHAEQINTYLKKLPFSDIAKAMHTSAAVAEKTHELIARWGSGENSAPAALSFVGDIYSGLQVHSFTSDDHDYAQKHLKILSGLYGVLRPLDLIEPYRMEMGYRFPDLRYKNLYAFWGDSIVKSLPGSEVIINTSSVEYSRVVTDYVDSSRLITPQFFTISAKTNKPTFVTVHSKVARGAFAHWLIKNKVQTVEELHLFDELGYMYSPELSASNKPAFVCREFGGIGLSVRLS